MNTATIRRPDEPVAPVAYATDDERWAAVVARAHEADGHFYYSVRSTGVYCRPSCPSRTPRRANVAFHATALDAEAATLVAFDPRLREAAGSQGMFVAPVA